MPLSEPNIDMSDDNVVKILARQSPSENREVAYEALAADPRGNDLKRLSSALTLCFAPLTTCTSFSVPNSTNRLYIEYIETLARLPSS